MSSTAGVVRWNRTYTTYIYIMLPPHFKRCKICQSIRNSPEMFAQTCSVLSGIARKHHIALRAVRRANNMSLNKHAGKSMRRRRRRRLYISRENNIVSSHTPDARVQTSSISFWYVLSAQRSRALLYEYMLLWFGARKKILCLERRSQPGWCFNGCCCVYAERLYIDIRV